MTRRWRYVGDLMPERTQCPGCDTWCAPGLADTSGWCAPCVAVARQPGLFPVVPEAYRRTPGRDTS